MRYIKCVKFKKYFWYGWNFLGRVGVMLGDPGKILGSLASLVQVNIYYYFYILFCLPKHRLHRCCISTFLLPSTAAGWWGQLLLLIAFLLFRLLLPWTHTHTHDLFLVVFYCYYLSPLSSSSSLLFIAIATYENDEN